MSDFLSDSPLENIRLLRFLDCLIFSPDTLNKIGKSVEKRTEHEDGLLLILILIVLWQK